MFDALEDLVKARKAKGLDNWKKLEHLATKLAGKHSADISFTCAHPKHGGSGDTHNLGSTEGNLHFLLGYANPGFHLAPYHWQIIYPDLDDEEVETFAAEQGHPSQSRLWTAGDLDVDYEGDLEEGTPHARGYTIRNDKEKSRRSLKAKSLYGTYTADPVEGTVTESGTEKIYKWELIENSFFAYENPDIVEAMEAVKPEKVEKSLLPEVVSHMLTSAPWAKDVYPMVKSLFPKPGSAVTVKSGQETIYGLVHSDHIELVDSAGHPVEFEQYDRSYSKIDLRKGGDIHPSIIYNFGRRYLAIDGEHLESIVKAQNAPVSDSYPHVVEGFPSKGWDEAPAQCDENLNKSVVLQDNTFRLVID